MILVNMSKKGIIKTEISDVVDELKKYMDSASIDSLIVRKLTDAEYEEVKKHPAIGSWILNTLGLSEVTMDAINYHHERYDGCGYPENLSGENIPYLARIAAVADSFDAMTSRRTYRDSLPLDIVIEEIRKNKGSQFDPNLADTFLNILSNNYNEIATLTKLK